MAKTLYDNKADQEYAPGKHDSLGTHPEHAEAEIADLENQFAAGSAPEPTYSKSAADASQLKEGEENAPDRSTNSAADDINEKLGKGYTGKGSTKSKGLSKLYGSNSKTKKIAIAGAAAGGSLIGGVLVFIALLPLKIESIVNNLESTFSSTTQEAVGKETEHMFSRYVVNSILPSLNAGTCHSTIDPSCVVTPNGTGPFGKVSAAWSKGRLENKLASNSGIIFAKKGPNFYMTLDGANIDLSQVKANQIDLFDLPGTKQVSRNEIRQALSDGLKKGTLWDRTYGRFKYGKYLESQFGIKRCIIACKVTDKFTDKITDKKLAAKAYLIQRLVPEKYGVIMQCVLLGGAGCSTNLDPASPGDSERSSPAQKQIQQTLQDAAGHFTESSFADLVKQSQDISKDGVKKVVAREVAKKIASAFGKDATGEAAEKAVPVIGWVFLAAKIAKTAGDIGPTIRYMSYAASAASAVELYSSYHTVASEMKSGHVDPTELGSFTQALSTNLTGSTSDQVDATQTPLYGYLYGDSSQSTSFVNNLLPQKAYADSTQSPYTCDDGGSVPATKLVCNEEDLARGNATANDVSGFVNSIPGLSYVTAPINAAESLSSSIFSGIYNGVCAATSVLHVCSGFENFVSTNLGGLFSWLQDKLIVTPISDNMSGGRTFDMMAAGADVSYNQSCQAQLGCAKMSDNLVASIRNQQSDQQKTDFYNESVFARMFNTSSSYSLVSKLAMSMPTTLVGATSDGVASAFTNPIAKVTGAVSSIFSGGRAFAATPAQPDPFGVVQYGYSDSQIPSDPETFWNQNCVSGPLAKYDESSDTLDVSDWLNAQTQDPDTGEPVATSPNPCLLIQSTAQSAGGLFDPSLLPQDAGTDSQSDTGTTDPTPSADIVTLAKQVLANSNIKFVNGSDADIKAAANGQKITPGPQASNSGLGPCAARTPTYLSPTLLQAMLNIALKYSFTIGAIDSNHDCDTGRHPLGRAMDITAINGKTIVGNGSQYTGDVQLDREFANFVMLVLPKGKFINSKAVGMGGVGQQECLSPAIQAPDGINYFADSCDHLHVDVGDKDG